MAKARKEKEITKESLMDSINASNGAGSIMTLNQKPMKVETISTGSLGLDIALGTGGLPKGRVVEIYGPEASGKTTLAIHTIANCQKDGGLAAVVDVEHAFDRNYAEALGVDLDNLLISQPDSGEHALEIAEQLIRSNIVSLVLIDSVSALVPQAEIEGAMGDSKMGLQARLMSQALRKITGAIAKSNCCCIFINQLRDKIGNVWGNPETTTGGNALKFYASVRLDIRRSGSLVKDKDGNVICAPTKVKVVKNKLAPPFTFAIFDMEFGTGISFTGELLDYGESAGLLEKSGSWYSYQGNKLGNGRPACKQFLEDNPELAQEIRDKIMEAYS